jgi:hypothetical protein
MTPTAGPQPLRDQGKESVARRELVERLLKSGPNAEAAAQLREELRAGGLTWFTGVVVAALNAGELQRAGMFYELLASLRWGSRWYRCSADHPLDLVPDSLPNESITIPKLHHDIEQLTYLRDHGILGEEFLPVIARYHALLERMLPLGVNARLSLDHAVRQSIGGVYNRIVHIRRAPRVRQALSSEWHGSAIEREYIDKPPGLVVVDSFLSREALESLRHFCLESTVWSSNRHPHGRLGAQFQNGFNCPLLIQIAEELRERLPNLIGNHYPLRHLWGYKSPPTLAADVTTHADFAAVNVNFWITPDAANVNPGGGGMVVYGVDAPLHWDFDAYNSRLDDVIRPFLDQQRPRVVTIPYRQNRAVIFNSDLFHATSELNFRPEYEYRRINVTLLYGDRHDDIHHKGLARVELSASSPPSRPSWRSAAFAHARRVKS